MSKLIVLTGDLPLLVGELSKGHPLQHATHICLQYDAMIIHDLSSIIKLHTIIVTLSYASALLSTSFQNVPFVLRQYEELLVDRQS